MWGTQAWDCGNTNQEVLLLATGEKLLSDQASHRKQLETRDKI